MENAQASEPRGRLLVIDDDPSVLRALAAYFDKLGYEVSQASTGEEGLQRWDRERPGVTILDLRLPDIDGLEVLQNIRRQHGVVIMLTGEGEIETAVEAIRLGAESFLQKPVEMSHLAASVTRAFDKARLQVEVFDLRRRVSPKWSRHMTRLAVAVGLIVVSVAAGLWIGGVGRREDVRAPIPVPLDHLDSVRASLPDSM